MRKQPLGKLVSAVFAVGWLSAATAFAKAPEWSMNATIIEACSCPMFCQCYFSTEPASHAGHGKFCKFNMAHKVNKGRHGNVKLDGAKFWIAGDLGDNFGDGEAEWAQVSFDPAVTKEQRDAIASILTHVYPVKWKSFTIGKDAPIDWKADDARAEARLDGGKSGELVLVRNPSANAKGPTVIKNLRYFGAPRNQGFVLMPNQVEAYRVGANKFEFKGTNGFMITYDISSKDVAAAQAGAAKGGTPH